MLQDQFWDDRFNPDGYVDLDVLYYQEQNGCKNQRQAASVSCCEPE